jgi:hypothetical protein
MIPDGRQPLDLSRHQDLYTFLNRTYWPASYAHMRRMAAFQNRVFQAFAEKYHTGYFDVSAQLPRDPDLFGDAIHMGEPGLRLQAWILLQQLVPWLDEQLKSGRLPRAMRRPLQRHPASLDVLPEVVRLSDVKRECH